MATIFISFAGRDDLEIVEALQAAFLAAGHTILVDMRGRGDVQLLIEAADVVLVLVSDDVATSEAVRREFELAQSLGKLVIALRVRLIPLPRWLQSLPLIPYVEPQQVVRDVEKALDIPPLSPKLPAAAVGEGVDEKQKKTFARNWDEDALVFGDAVEEELPAGGRTAALPPAQEDDLTLAGSAPSRPSIEELEAMSRSRGVPPMQRKAEKEVSTTPVEFAAYHPPEAKAGAPMLFLVYAFTDLAQLAVEQDAATYIERLGGTLPAPRLATEKPSLRVNTPLTVILYPSWQEETWQQTQRWNGAWLRFAFDLPIPPNIEDRISVTVSIQVRGFEIARISDCAIHVFKPIAITAPPTNPLAAAKLMARQTRPYQSIFVSYSRKDKAVVDAYRVAQLALGNQVFIDTYSIRVGENWRAALAEAIDRADVFQLFWSRNAAASENVQDEWDYALHYRCADDGCVTFIRPVYWELPVPPIPEPLSHLNFVYAQLAPYRNWMPWMLLGGVVALIVAVILIALLA